MQIFPLISVASCNLVMTGFCFPGCGWKCSATTPAANIRHLQRRSKSRSLFHLNFPLVPNFTIFVWETQKYVCTHKVALVEPQKCRGQVKFSPAKKGCKRALTAFRRIQEECKSRNYPGHDEDRYGVHRSGAGTAANSLQYLGHVEKTNDRDYEVEER
jgi:hypothetical protein